LRATYTHGEDQVRSLGQGLLGQVRLPVNALDSCPTLLHKNQKSVLIETNSHSGDKISKLPNNYL